MHNGNNTNNTWNQKELVDKMAKLIHSLETVIELAQSMKFAAEGNRTTDLMPDEVAAIKDVERFVGLLKQGKTNFEESTQKEIGLYQCGLCADFSIHLRKPNGCPICKEGNPFMELIGNIAIVQPSNKPEYCPLCYQKITEGSQHGSWCKNK